MRIQIIVIRVYVLNKSRIFIYPQMPSHDSSLHQALGQPVLSTLYSIPILIAAAIAAWSDENRKCLMRLNSRNFADVIFDHHHAHLTYSSTWRLLMKRFSDRRLPCISLLMPSHLRGAWSPLLQSHRLLSKFARWHACALFHFHISWNAVLWWAACVPTACCRIRMSTHRD